MRELPYEIFCDVYRLYSVKCYDDTGKYLEESDLGKIVVLISQHFPKGEKHQRGWPVSR
jgi:hypothetical protein